MVRITCISKQGGDHDDPYHAIERLGWVNEATGVQGNSTREAMYDYLKKGNKAFVRDAYGNVAYLAPRENARGTQYVQTYADQTWTDNLLQLPECR